MEVDPDRFDAVIFDLDGVITDTARLHLATWRELFDSYLGARHSGAGAPFSDEDYRRYVDGRPRYDGVAAFLAARGIDLPWGDPSDAAGEETVCGLGNRKNELFRAVLDQGIAPYPSSVEVVHALRAVQIATAIVSSSRNTVAVLEAAGIRDLFDVKVDGVDAAQRGLPGKPDPALFLAAARELGVQPSRAVVVEDAAAGVQAGSSGGFGLVVGVARGGDPEALLSAGAEVTVTDLAELHVSHSAGDTRSGSP